MSNSDRSLSTGYDSEYHDRQFLEPYKSTVLFCDWLKNIGAIGGVSVKICDLGCGKGANLYYMSNRFPNCEFIGLDIDSQLIRDGSDFLSKKSTSNCQLIVGDLFAAGSQFGSGAFDGIISMQTLSWLPGYEMAIDSIVSMRPKWMAFTSLFYNGLIEAKTVISEFNLNNYEGDIKNSLYYNTYSLPLIQKYLFDRGYKNFLHTPFEMPIDLPRNANGRMGTYTERTTDGRRLQISGPLLMNWQFIYASA